MPRAPTEDELRRRQLLQRENELGRGRVDEVPEQVVVELAADNGSDLRDLIGLGVTIEPCDQRIMERRA